MTDEERRATLSDDGRYRYDLTRWWGKRQDGVGLLWVMCNPSTADAAVDDPTIRRIRNFTKGWGYDGLVVVNLFAWRTSKPDRLWLAVDPVGPDNPSILRRWIQSPDIQAVVAAWGTAWRRSGHARFNIEGWAAEVDKPVLCLGRAKDGDPCHPLYIRAGTQPEPFT